MANPFLRVVSPEISSFQMSKILGGVQCFVFQNGVRSTSIMVLVPSSDDYLCVCIAAKSVYGHTLIPELTVRGFVGSGYAKKAEI